MKLLAVLIVGASLIGPAVQARKRPKPCSYGEAIERRHCKAHRLCSNARPRWCDVNTAIHFHLSRWQRAWMKRVAWCESRDNPNAVGGPNLGRFQFNRGTWARLPRRYSSHSPFSAKFSSLAAGYMLVSGRANEWACK